MAIKFRTKAACRIAGVDPLRLNEAIYAGNYPCAPETRSGASRTFEEIDLITLTLWRDLMKNSEIHRMRIGDLVCRVHALLKADNLGEIERLDMPMNVFDFMRTAKAEDPVSFDFPTKERHTFSAMSFDVKGLREEVRARIAEEMETIGEED